MYASPEMRNLPQWLVVSCASHVRSARSPLSASHTHITPTEASSIHSCAWIQCPVCIRRAAAILTRTCALTLSQKYGLNSRCWHKVSSVLGFADRLPPALSRHPFGHGSEIPRDTHRPTITTVSESGLKLLRDLEHEDPVRILTQAMEDDVASPDVARFCLRKICARLPASGADRRRAIAGGQIGALTLRWLWS